MNTVWYLLLDPLNCNLQSVAVQNVGWSLELITPKLFHWEKIGTET